jgi:hypothetical protein
MFKSRAVLCSLVCALVMTSAVHAQIGKLKDALKKKTDKADADLANVEVPAPQGALVAKPYAGALRTGEETYSTGQFDGLVREIYLSKDPIEKVRQFYAELGEEEPLEPQRAQLEFKANTGQMKARRTGFFVVALTEKQVSAALVKATGRKQLSELGGPGVRGVIVESLERVESQQVGLRWAYLNPVTEPLAKLQLADEAELKQLAERYAHLPTAYYAPADPQVPDGETTADRILAQCKLVADYGAAQGGTIALDKERLTRLTMELQAANAAGRVEEAQRIAKQLETLIPKDAVAAPAAGPKMLTKSEWLSCLDRLDQAAYRTRIVIDRYPTSWQ